MKTTYAGWLYFHSTSDGSFLAVDAADKLFIGDEPVHVSIKVCEKMVKVLSRAHDAKVRESPLELCRTQLPVLVRVCKLERAPIMVRRELY